MRFSDVMTPARSWEEAAMMPAKMATLSGGAALKSVRIITKDLETVEVTENKKTAAGDSGVMSRRRSALRHALKQQF